MFVREHRSLSAFAVVIHLKNLIRERKCMQINKTDYLLDNVNGLGGRRGIYAGVSDVIMMLHTPHMGREMKIKLGIMLMTRRMFVFR